MSEEYRPLDVFWSVSYDGCQKNILQVKTVFWVWLHWEFVTLIVYLLKKAVDGTLDF